MANVNLVVNTFAFFDMILIAVVFNIAIVKYLRENGKAYRYNRFKRYYFLFVLFVLSNVGMALWSSFALLPFLQQNLIGNLFKPIFLSATLISVSNLFFTWEFDYKPNRWFYYATLIFTLLTVITFFG